MSSVTIKKFTIPKRFVPAKPNPFITAIQSKHEIGIDSNMIDIAPSVLTKIICEYSVNVRTFPELDALDVENYYIENFFGKEQADSYLAALLKDYPFQQEQVRFMGQVHNQPRLTRFMGNKGKTYFYSGFYREAVEWIPSALEIRDRIMETILKIRPDHPLLTTSLGNLYRDGLDSVGMHSDDETDLSSDCMIASLSLGSERDFDIRLKGFYC